MQELVRQVNETNALLDQKIKRLEDRVKELNEQVVSFGGRFPPVVPNLVVDNFHARSRLRIPMGADKFS
ncbi:hypothetical protein LCGC14_1569740 [marine sediment metagenome]|uniref:Uncharacterized protein n=1 Tax=marine sediment metagenome TaxID=412755 RepID=A0A0F9IK52_9ZZZZ